MPPGKLVRQAAASTKLMHDEVNAGRMVKKLQYGSAVVSVAKCNQL
jgi:hypothetical protein